MADTLSRQHTGRSLIFGAQPSFSLFPLGVRFEDVRWGDDSSSVSIAIRGGHVAVEFGSLFDSVPNVQEISLDDPVVRIREMTDAAPEEQAVTSSQPAAEAGKAPLPIELARTTITDGTLVMEQADGGRLTLSALNIAVDNLKDKASSTLDGVFAMAVKLADGSVSAAACAMKARADLALPAVRGRH